MTRAYSELSTERMNGMTSGPIPFLSMLAWADYHGIDRDATRRLVHVLRLVDADNLRRARTK